MSENIYPKVTVDLSRPVDAISDLIGYKALNNRKFNDLYAVENTNAQAECVGGEPLRECEASTRALGDTIALFSQDRNDNLTGLVGYEKANATCSACESTCSVRLHVQDGIPTEKARFLYGPSIEKLVREGKITVLKLSGFDKPV